MGNLSADLSNLEACLPAGLDPERAARAKTLLLQRLALAAHRFYGGKIQTLPRAPVPAAGWLDVWYTPGVSAVSTAIRDDQDSSFELSGRGNLVAVVSDGTRVLGDGDVTPAGALGVMEGKAFLMKYLAGIDAVPLCVDSRGADGRNDPAAVIELVRRCRHSFGAVNLEDISQPNCYAILDALRDSCGIPVWHDDAQGTACVVLAGLLGALAVAGKRLERVRIVFLGAGAANTASARLAIAAGADPAGIALFDATGALSDERADYRDDPRYLPVWELCRVTNPGRVRDLGTALAGADALVCASAPGPNPALPEMIRRMAPGAAVFACANPVPEIYPHAAVGAGALVVATGRGDFPNQVNNALAFPGILKGALLARSRTISDGMAIAAAGALHGLAARQGLAPQRILPALEDPTAAPLVAEAVAAQSAAEGHARRTLPAGEAGRMTARDAAAAREALDLLSSSGLIAPPPQEMLDEALAWALRHVG